ncbi:hypothetical protein MNBD_GAMMA14-624 [hydrothermal vent metagenome]|uniref:Uncharacterized protein n=1 Tax=hydrothermal vent metagenome TaxID=652676 RepID=A0A3B0Z3C8_9ZZZZ
MPSALFLSIFVQCPLPSVAIAATTLNEAKGDSVSSRETSKDNRLRLSMATQYKVSQGTRKL